MIQQQTVKSDKILFLFFFLAYIPESFVHPPRIPSKRHYQRLLHESYQVRVTAGKI